MKKQVKKQKTLALNKVQIMKMREMKMVNGGNNKYLDDEPITGPRTLGTGR